MQAVTAQHAGGAGGALPIDDDDVVVLPGHFVDDVVHLGPRRPVHRDREQQRWAGGESGKNLVKLLPVLNLIKRIVAAEVDDRCVPVAIATQFVGQTQVEYPITELYKPAGLSVDLNRPATRFKLSAQFSTKA